MIFQFLLLFVAVSAVNEPLIHEKQIISCSCKKKRKSTYKENWIACFCDEEPLLEEELSRKAVIC